MAVGADPGRLLKEASFPMSALATPRPVEPQRC